MINLLSKSRLLLLLITVGLFFCSTKSNSQEAKEIDENTPIAFRGSSIKSLEWVDKSGKLKVNEVLERISEFKDAVITKEDDNYFGNTKKGDGLYPITWRIFKLNNITENDITIQIEFADENQRSREVRYIYELFADNKFQIIQNKSVNNKNYITQQNIWSDGGKKVPSRNMSVTIPKKTETRILMGSYLSKHEYIVFSDALKYAEWNRGSMYIQGICLGALTSLFFLALFSAYKFKNQPSYWYAIWLFIQTLVISQSQTLSGSRLSEFLLGHEDLTYWSYFQLLSHLSFMIFAYKSVEHVEIFPRFKKPALMLISIFASTGLVGTFIMFTGKELFSNSFSAIFLIFIGAISIFISLIVSIFLDILLIYLVLRSISKDASLNSLALALVATILASISGFLIIGFDLIGNDSLLYTETAKETLAHSTYVLVAIFMGWSTISKSKNIQDQLLNTTKEKNYLITNQNQILEEKVIERTKELQLQTDKTERLMLNILPQSIADRLKQGDREISDKYQNTTILFSDLVGFTKMSSEKTPEELVFLLNDLFKRFDIRGLSLGLEKIKTIGDAYMVVGGLPNIDDTHAIRITKMALGMYEDLAEFNTQHGVQFEMRIGINSGPVVAGVIGHSKFSYDLWGSAVNTASRMESTSMPGKIQVSPSTFEQIKDHFDLQEHQLVECKGLGLIRTHFVISQLSK